MDLKELLTSEFTEGYSNDELISILMEFRKKYRESHSENIRLNRVIQTKKQEFIKIEEHLEEKDRIINTLRERLHKGRDLSLKERISGKITKF